MPPDAAEPSEEADRRRDGGCTGAPPRLAPEGSRQANLGLSVLPDSHGSAPTRGFTLKRDQIRTPHRPRQVVGLPRWQRDTSLGLRTCGRVCTVDHGDCSPPLWFHRSSRVPSPGAAWATSDTRRTRVRETACGSPCEGDLPPPGPHPLGLAPLCGEVTPSPRWLTGAVVIAQCRVMDLNHRGQSRLIYSQIPSTRLGQPGARSGTVAGTRSKLPRVDSNHDQLIQNQPSCRLDEGAWRGRLPERTQRPGVALRGSVPRESRARRRFRSRFWRLKCTRLVERIGIEPTHGACKALSPPWNMAPRERPEIVSASGLALSASALRPGRRT